MATWAQSLLLMRLALLMMVASQGEDVVAILPL
jgi:hypothetical protein